ncbi:MAG: 50S ribosomal protein L21 [Verrucomicrobiota bacterium]
MFAVIKTGGKQYRIKEGDVLDVELLDDLENGKKAEFSEVLLVSNGDQVTVGKPTISGASVSAEVIGEVKGDKVVAFKYRRREGYHRTVGHRQRYVRVKVDKIKG